MALGLVDATGAAEVATGDAAATAALGDGAAATALGEAATAGLTDAAGAIVGAAPVVAGEVGATAIGVLQAASTAEATGNPAPTAARRRNNCRRVVRFNSVMNFAGILARR